MRTRSQRAETRAHDGEQPSQAPFGAAGAQQAQLRAAQRMVDTSPPASRFQAKAQAVAQRVRFSNSNSFYGPQLSPLDLPGSVSDTLSRLYDGKTEDKVAMVELVPHARQWLSENTSLGDHTGERAWVEIQARDWEGLGARQVPAIELGSMSQSFFDQQSALMGQLDTVYNGFIANNPGRPLRIASFQFARVEEGPLITNWALKPIEDLVAPSVQAAFLPDTPQLADIRASVRANVNQTLFSAGQFQWLASNWADISQTHDVYVDVDYYPNRLPDRGGLLHKDSVGETLFVNLSYNNAEEGVAPEHVVDNQGHAPFEERFPQSAKDLLETTRADNAEDDGSIKGLALPARGRASFIDPAVWHATPLYGHRNLQPSYQDDLLGTYEQLRTDVRNEPSLGDTQREAALQALEGRDGEVRGSEANALLQPVLRQHELLRFGSLAGVHAPVDTAPLRRRRRARSVDLTDHPERLPGLQEQSQQARSFIRTWVILRRKPAVD